MGAFYVTSPIKRIIGFGVITQKTVDDTLLFHDELTFRRPLWKYKIKCEVLATVPDWKKGIDIPSKIILNTGRKVVDESTFSSLLKQAETNWKVNIPNLL